MFQQPKQTTVFVAPATPIDPNERYLVKVIDLIDLGPTKFPNPTDDPDNPTHRIQWNYVLADIHGQKILDIEGNPYVHHDYTSSKTSKSTKAGGKTATARLWMEALFGKPLEDDEIGADIANQLKGKSAIALFEERQKESQAGEPYTALQILRLSPRKENAADTAATAVRASAERNQATVARAVATAAPVDDGLPF